MKTFKEITKHHIERLVERDGDIIKSIDHVHERINSVMEVVNELDKKINNHNIARGERIKDIENQLASQYERVTQLAENGTKQLDNLRQHLAANEDRLDDAERHLQELGEKGEAQLGDIRERLDLHGLHLQAAQGRLNEAERGIESLNIRLFALDAENTRFVDRFTEIEEKLEALDRNVAGEIRDRSSQIDALRNRLNQVVNDVNAMDIKAGGGVADRMEFFQRRVTTLEEALGAGHGQRLKSIEARQDVTADFCSNLQREVQRLADLAEEKDDSLARAHDGLKTHEKHLGDIEITAARINGELHKVKQHVFGLEKYPVWSDPGLTHGYAGMAEHERNEFPERVVPRFGVEKETESHVRTPWGLMK